MFNSLTLSQDDFDRCAELSCRKRNAPHVLRCRNCRSLDFAVPPVGAISNYYAEVCGAPRATPARAVG
jgi:hypothetical protein